MKTLLSLLVLAFCVSAQQPPLRPVKVTLTSSATDTYAGTASPTLSAYVSGQLIMFTANAANTGAASINVDSVGALTIVKLGGGIASALADNDIRSGQQVMCQYDGTNCQMLSQLGNAASGGGGAEQFLMGTLTAFSSGLTRYYWPGTTAPIGSDFGAPMGRAGTVVTLFAKNPTPPPAGQGFTATLRKNGVDQDCTAVIDDTTYTGVTTTCSIAYSIGDELSVKVVNTATSGNTNAKITVVYQ